MLTLVLAMLAMPTADAGVRDSKKAALEDPLNAQAWMDLGDAYEKKGRDNAALRAYGRAAALDPTSEVAVTQMATVGAGRVKALERRALRNPEDDELWGDLADKYAAMGNTEQALKYYLYAMRLDPSDGEWQGGIASVGGPEAMAEAMESMMLGGGMNDESLGDFADVLFASGEVDRACGLWQQAQELDPSDSEWNGALATNCGVHADGWNAGEAYGLGMGEQAYPMMMEELLGEGSDPTPGVDVRSSSDSELLAAMGRTKLLVGDKEAALDLYERALTIDPVNASALHAVMVITGQTRLQLLHKLIEQVPPNDEMYGDLGDTQLAAGNLAEARGAYERALELDPSDSEWQQKLLVTRVDEAGTVDLSP